VVFFGQGVAVVALGRKAFRVARTARVFGSLTRTDAFSPFSELAMVAQGRGVTVVAWGVHALRICFL